MILCINALYGQEGDSPPELFAIKSEEGIIIASNRAGVSYCFEMIGNDLVVRENKGAIIFMGERSLFQHSIAPLEVFLKEGEISELSDQKILEKQRLWEFEFQNGAVGGVIRLLSAKFITAFKPSYLLWSYEPTEGQTLIKCIREYIFLTCRLKGIVFVFQITLHSEDIGQRKAMIARGEQVLESIRVFDEPLTPGNIRSIFGLGKRI